MSILSDLKIYISNFFTKGNQRTLEAKKNITASFAIKGLSICINLALVPLTIHYVNPTQYGIWLTLSSIIAWFSFFDIGFGNGLRNKLAETKATGNIEKSKIYVSTTYAILFLIFTGVWLLFFGLNVFLDWTKLLNAPPAMADELSKLALIVFSFFCLRIVMETINTVLIADQKPAKAAFFDMLGQLIALLVIFTLTKTTSGSLLNLGLSLGFIPIFVLLISSFWFYRKQYKNISPSYKFVKFSYAKDIMTLGAKFFVIQIAAIVIYQTTNIIIAQVSGPENVTVYNIAFKYFNIAIMIFSIIVSPMWSAFTEAFTLKDYEWMKKTTLQLRKIVYLLVVFVIVMIPFSNLFYTFWVGNLVKVRWSISLVISFYIITNLWNMLHAQILNGMGKIKLQLYVSLIGMTLNIPLAIFLGKRFGIEGVVLSSVILNLISAIYAPYQVSLLLNKKAKGIWNG